MTKNETLRRFRLDHYLISIGFTADEVASLRRISSTLRRWYELECGSDSGCIERSENDGKPFWVTQGTNYHRHTPIPDREAGALRRLSRIIKARNERASDELDTYIQSDPRGASLYILRPGDIPADCSVESCYTRGICVF